MILFILGIIIGLLLSIICIMVTSQKPKIERIVNQIQNKLKQNGAILEPENEDLKNWIESLPHDEPTM